MKFCLYYLGILILCSGVLSSCNSDTKKESLRPPNVVVILTDDQGWGDLSFHGNKNLYTPNLDRIAEDGAHFEWFYVQPVCSPTRAEMLTGRYHPRGGVSGTSEGKERLDIDEETIAEVFKKAGYATAAYGKWHNGMQYPYHPNARGFDDFYGFCSGHWGDYFSPMLEHNGRIVTGEGYIIDDLTNRAMDFIEQHRDSSFFLYLPYNTPHGPMLVPDEWWERFENKELSMRYRDPASEEIEFTRAALAMCENIDWNVGRVLKKLEEVGLEEQTIVVYFNDNGPNSFRWNGGMKGRKGWTDEGGVRSPLFIKYPQEIQPGTRIEEISGAIDLLPTLADLAGIEYHTVKKLDGISFSSALKGQSMPDQDRLIFNYFGGKSSVRSQQYRLDQQGQLFNINSDIGQQNDISGEKPKVAEELSKALSQWREEVLSELPAKGARSFVLGHPAARFTQLPARDAQGHGNIKRSNIWPNCSFNTNWISINDSITWNVEVPADGDFKVTLYYTCPAGSEGSRVSLSFGDDVLQTRISEAHDPPLKGMEYERVPRTNSYVKDFKPIEIGVMHLKKGQGDLVLKATEMPGDQVMDFRLLLFERLHD